MKIAIVIPARYESTRFPGKPLALINGIPMIARTYERCTLSKVPRELIWVATDSRKIAEECANRNMNFMWTPSACANGTERVYEATKSKHLKGVDLFINVQGDEPLIDPADINKVIAAAESHEKICAMVDSRIALVPHNPPVFNAFCPITTEEEFRSRNVPKVVFRQRVTDDNSVDCELLYASRGAIPTDKSLRFTMADRQVCIYAFTREHLRAFCSAPSKTPLEQIEDIEILRFLEMGIPVRMVPVSSSSISVDIREDITKVEEALLARGHK